MDAFDPDLSKVIPLIILGAIESKPDAKAPMNTGLPGGDYLRELLETGHPKRIYCILRIKKETFQDLCLWLRRNTDLTDSWRILIEEQVAMFL